MNNHISVTIGIPAHNEEGNIEVLLRSILMQKIDKKYTLKNIIVACDGCNDLTSSIVKLLSKEEDSRIKVVDDGKRLGQIGRLNQFYKSVKEDVFITFDADTRLGSEFVVNNILKAFEDKRVALVGGNDTPDHPKTLISKIGNVWVSSWYLMRYKLNGGDTVHNHKGCVSAGRINFLKNIVIPPNVYSNDDYLYFSCKLAGLKFKFVETAVVYYKIPTTFHEYMIQTTRFLGLKHRISDHFGDWVYREYKVPVSAKVKGLALTFMRHPILMLLAICLQIFQRIARNYYIEKYQGVSWKVIGSSKK